MLKGRLKNFGWWKTNDGASNCPCGIIILGGNSWEPSENNAHPHRSDDGNVTAVHNGITAWELSGNWKRNL